jgi:hypothetical protein
VLFEEDPAQAGPPAVAGVSWSPAGLLDATSGARFAAAEAVWRVDTFAPLLQDIAEDRRRVLWVSLDEGEVFAPYAGGVDLIVRDELRRAELHRRFAAWRSPRPDGL